MDTEVPEEIRANPGRIADRHVSFLFEPRLQGSYVHVMVRAASRIPSAQVNHSRGLCGELTMTQEEWHLFSVALASVETPGPIWFGPLRLLCGAGHPDLAEVETDHETQHFIEIAEMA